MEDKKIKKVLLNLRRVIKQVWMTDKKYLPITIAITLTSSITPAISLTLMQNIVNKIQTRDLTHSVFVLIGFYVLVDLISTLIHGFQGFYNTKFNLKFNLAVNKSILKKACDLKLRDYENSDTYDKIKRAQYDSDGKLILYLNSFISLFGLGITFISFLVILMRFRVWIVFVILMVPIVKFIIMNKFNKKQFNYLAARTNEEREAWYYSHVLISGDNYKELKIFDLFQYFTNKYIGLVNKFNHQDLTLNKEMVLKITALEIIEQIINGAIFMFIVFNGIVGQLLIGDVVTYTRSSLSTKDQFQSILRLCSSIFKDNLYINQLFDFLDIEVKTKDSSDAILIDRIDEIRVVNLSYKYRAQSDYVLKNINMTLRRNELSAIVGRNGSGKTTLAKIIMGLYDDYEGEIYINGTNLKKIDDKSYTKRIGALMQDFTKYAGTIRDNIALGNLDYYNSDDMLLDISDKFQIKEFVLNESAKLETQLGFWFKAGKQISIGQWQKIALSRAFIKSADLYVLDEPNAALDAISEYDISKLYSELLFDKLGIIIAHRFNNFIKNADNIIVLEKGELISQGSHAELVQNCDTYNLLYSLQIRNDEEIEYAS